MNTENPTTGSAKLDARALYPDMGDGDSDFFYGPSDYTPIIEALGTVVHREDDKDYQGDTYVLLRREDGALGYLTIGWGSCSGCDALQACNTYADIQQLADKIANAVHWLGSPQYALRWFKERDWAGSEYGWEDSYRAVRGFVDEATKKLEAMQ